MEKHKKLYTVSLILYTGFLCGILFGRRGYHTANTILYWDYVKRNIQLIPMKTIAEMMKQVMDSTAYASVRILAGINVLGNVAMMVPIGYLAPACLKRIRRGTNAMSAVVVSLVLVEIIQVLTLKGAFDIDDILLNLLGNTIGFFAYKTRIRDI